MTTRDEIIAQYVVDAHGIIRSPGKFEGEPMHTVYFWNLTMDGGGETYDDGGRPVDFFVVTPEDRAMFPALADVYGVSLYESDQGFVNLTEYRTKRQYLADIETVEVDGLDGDEEATP